MNKSIIAAYEQGFMDKMAGLVRADVLTALRNAVRTRDQRLIERVSRIIERQSKPIISKVTGKNFRSPFSAEEIKSLGLPKKLSLLEQANAAAKARASAAFFRGLFRPSALLSHAAIPVVGIPGFAGAAGLVSGLSGNNLTQQYEEPLPENAGSAARAGRFVHKIWSTPYNAMRIFGAEVAGHKLQPPIQPKPAAGNTNGTANQTVKAENTRIQ